MEAEKSHNLLSASWTPRKAGGVVQRPDHQELRGQEKINSPVQAVRQRANPTFLNIFVLLGPLTDWMVPPTLGRAICVAQSMNSNVNLF